MSITCDRPRRPVVLRALARRGIARVLVLVVVVLSTVLGVTPASAYWSASGAGGAVGQTGNLAAPTDVTVPPTAVGDVPLSWTPGSGGTTPDGYYVTRVGATTAAACASSPDNLLITTSCVDTDVPDGQYTYRVTAVVATWTARATSESITVLPPPLVGDAGRYSVLGGGGVTNTLASTVSGDLGVGPGLTADGFPPGLVGGDIHLGDADAVAALADAADAYAALRQQPVTAELSGDLAGLTLSPGIYHSTGALGVTGTVTLAGGADDVFVIRVDAALNTAALGRVVLSGGVVAANVYWVVDGAVTLGAGTQFAGTILAHGAITLGLGTELIGRALATGAVTMARTTVRFTAALPPTLSIAGPETVVTKDTSPAISGTSNVPSRTTVTVTIGGQTRTTAVQSDGGWTVTAASLLAGSYPVVAQVRDADGNSTKAFQTIVVEVNPAPVPLGSAASFSVLGGGAGAVVASTGLTALSGDLGSSPGSISGFPPGTLSGVVHDGDPTAATAQTDLLAAITDGSGRRPHTEFAGDLAARNFHIGVHHSLAAVGLTGVVTLDGEGDANAVFIFQISGALTGAASCEVDLINGAQSDHVFWVVDGAVTLGAGCHFAGTLLAKGAVTLGLAASLDGQVLSRGAVTLANNAITGAAPAPAARARHPAPPSASDLPSTSTQPSASDSPSASSDPSATPEATPTPTPSPTPTPNATPSPTALPSPTPTPRPAPTSEVTP